MGESVVLRHAVVNDAAGIAHVHVTTWQHAYRGIVPESYLQGLDVAKRTNYWERWLEGYGLDGHQALVAEAGDGQIVGFASFGREREGGGPRDGEIGALYILPNYQRCGIGRRLLSGAARLLLQENFQTLQIWVLQDNPARAFYEKLGGRRVREKKIQFGGKELVEVAYFWNDVAATFWTGAG